MEAHVPFAYYKRLPARARRIYDQSNATSRVRLPEPERFEPLVAAVARALHAHDRDATETAAARLVAGILGALGISGVRLRVLAKRPSHSWGELHGLYEPEAGRKPLITVWMRTAQRRQVVAFKTFLRTLLHELCHHLDYELYRLPETFHTEGFYKRESSLYYQIRGEAAPAAAAGVTRARRRPSA
jgi:hypothetical protein